MTALIWDKLDERVYEGGLDRGVLYLSNGSAVPWNGLVSVSESTNKEANPVYFEGIKVNTIVSPGEFEGSIKALTYPDEFLDYEGIAEVRPGFYLGDQKPKPFGLSYRTYIGNALDGGTHGYKLHILYNLVALPATKEYATVSPSGSLMEFEWSVAATPSEIPGFRPSAHVILNSLEMDPAILAYIETQLYGSVSVDASLPAIEDLVAYIISQYPITIVDNGDGTWTISTTTDGQISVDLNDLFTVIDVTAIYLDAATYQV